MAKKLIDIKSEIESSGIIFYKYLHDLLADDIMEKLDSLTQITDVYLFSGIIRNYFLKIYLKRDIDVVLGREIDIAENFKDLKISKNSFGGYKIIYPSGPLDLWFLKDTWAFQHEQKTLDFELEKKIPYTSFFNFSSVIYSINSKKFYYTDFFVKFLRNKTLDYVYKPNANYPLCVINTLYYSDKYDLKITNRLKKFIIELDLFNKGQYESTQLKHFGAILYSKEDIEFRLNQIKATLTNK